MTKPIRLITLAPGHFHAALVLKRAAAGVHPRSFVYGPLDRDTVTYIDRVAAFNARADEPTAWEIDLRAGPDWLDRFLREQPGNTVVLAGRNRPKIDLMRAAVANGLHVLADKPWVVDAADLPKLEEVLRDADLREVLTWEMLTERHEVTNQLQREFVRDPDIFGQWRVGTQGRPALVLESVHYLKKTVAGRRLARPWWWFDPAIAGEAMADVGTHLADLALWFVCPDQPVNYGADVKLLDADRWPLVLSEEQFRELTGVRHYPPELGGRVVNGQLYYAGNNTVTFALRGVHVRLSTTWDYEPSAGGGDTHEAVAHGTKAWVAVRQPPGARPELYVASAKSAEHAKLLAALEARCEALRFPFPGLSVEDLGSEARVVIPDELRTGHEAHFSELLEEYVRFFNAPRAVAPWERPNALAKYHITTKAVELARQKRPGR